MMKLPELADFIPHLHTRFEVASKDAYGLELTSATDLSNAQLVQFSLIFTGVASPYLPQALYELTHRQIGNLELFLVPVGPDQTGMRYEAVFSRFAGS